MNFVFGYPSDSLGYLVYMYDWLHTDLPRLGFLRSLFFTPMPQQPVLSIFLLLPALILPLFTAYNLVVGLTFLANFVITYLCARTLFSLRSSFVSALIVASSNFVQWQSTRSIEMAMVFWLPVMTVIFIKFIRNPKLKYILVLSLVSSLSFLTSFYLGYFSLLFTGGSLIFALFYWTFVYGHRLIGRFFFYVVVLASVFITLTLTSTWSLIGYRLGYAPPTTRQYFQTSFNRSDLNELVAFGARPWDYFLPSVYNPLFGRFSQEVYTFFQSRSFQFWSPYLPERSDYLTITAFILAVFGAYMAIFRGKVLPKLERVEPTRVVTVYLVFVSLFMFWVSLPAEITLKGVNFYFPSFFLHGIFPMFRVYARAGIFVVVAIAFLAGLGFELLKERLSAFYKYSAWIIFVAVCFLILFENITLPSLPVMAVGNVPQVYRWLSMQKDNVPIVEYPKDNSLVDFGGGCPVWLDSNVRRDYNGIYEFYYQTVHQHPVLPAGAFSNRERQLLWDLSSRETYNVLKSHKVVYVVVHTKDPLIGLYPPPYPQFNPLDECWMRRIMDNPSKTYSGFKEVAKFSDGVVYKVE
ncbi:MAG: hypothetical protein M1352_03020 [Patescibacteria group bacterium]|nr:hypothetical protein [Patescibacteria group bacterium]